MKSTSVEFTHILNLCPSIRYIHWGQRQVSGKTEREWRTLSRRRSTDTEDHSNDYEKREANGLRRVEFYNKHGQQHILALTTVLQEPSLLEHLRLAGKRGDLYQLFESFKYYNINLLSHPSQLKALELVDFEVIHDTANSISSEGFFNFFQHIERLKMDFCGHRFRNVDEERNTISKLVKVIGHQLHQLRDLYLDFAFCADGDTARILGDNVFTTLCDGNQKLEILHLKNASISNDMLLDLCHHPKLHTLKLEGYQVHKHLTVDGWISFARKLKEQEQNGGGRIQSIWLYFEYCVGITDEVLEEFAGIKSLESLRIERNRNITDTGVNKFASIRRSISKKYKRIELYNCSTVSLDNPNALFPSSSFCLFIY